MAEDASDKQRVRLTELARRFGATDEEIEEAGPFLGPLCLDLASRPEGELTPFAEVVEASNMSFDTASRMWRALGFPDPAVTATRLTTQEATVLRMFAFIAGDVLEEDRVADVARVIGVSTTHAAEALVDAFRIGYEVPELQDRGRPYAEVAAEYAEFVGAFLPEFLVGVGAVVRRHILGVAYRAWWTDDERSAVTVDRVVGFVDLVGYTASAMELSTSELKELVDRFERRVGEAVNAHGGGLVKMIGDEVMYVFEDAGEACRFAGGLLAEFGSEVRMGMAGGSVASIRGDYYGPVVNLASRLTAQAEPGRCLVSASLPARAGDSFRFEPAGPYPLKGVGDAVPAHRLL